MIDSDQYPAGARYASTRAACFGIAQPDASYDMVEPSSFTDLVEQEGVRDAYSADSCRSTCLAPEIVEAILDGQTRRAKANGDAGE
jgi:hypothetical protein